MSQFAVIGLGQFGFKVATTLSELGGEVLAIDADKAIIESVKDKVDRAVCIDCTEEHSLHATGIADIDTVVVAIGQHLEISLVTTALLRKFGVPKIVARASTPLHAQILDLIGAQKVINPEDQMAVVTAQTLITPDVYNRVPIAGNLIVAEIGAKSEFVGKTLLELNFRAKYNLNVIAIRRRIPVITEEGENAFREELNDSPAANTKIEPDDTLVVVGTDRQIRRLSKLQ
ncbi:MAG: TrkA family potassium uptake protein [Myxococcales bacterium]|nr:TrkA family potassium uptake protein [Myxococcales bacterium]